MKRAIPFFSCSISALLLIAGFAKLHGVFYPPPFMLASDPVFTFLTIRQVLGLAGLVEVILAIYICFHKQSMVAMVATSIFVSLVGAYRFIFLSTFFSQCNCMGILLEWLSLPEPVKNMLPVAILAYLGTASILVLSINLLSSGSGLRTPHSRGGCSRLLCYVICGFCFGASQVVCSGEITVLKGDVIYSSMPNGVIQNGKVTPQSAIPRKSAIGRWTNSFNMKISTDGSWMMEVSPVTFPGDLLYGKKQLVYQTFDKTNIYGAYYSEGVTQNRQVVGATNLASMEHFANISPEDYPMADLNMLPNLNVQFTPNILWLAFGSSDFFQKMAA